ncbi:MAG: nitroreductase family protein [Pseudomonadota bacterium]|nr:nitroreductase family protein [Pseudomonadota bacterium]
MNQPADQQRPFYLQYREPEYPINHIFLQRWSPRAYDASQMPVADLFTILEAARWAPSAYNIQPWRFLYATRDDEYWDSYLDLLDSFNASWAKHASALVFVVSDEVMQGNGSSLPKQSRTHSFDAGAAWAQLALQATALGYQAHAMAGILFDEVRQQLSIPENFRIEIAVAIGKQTAPSSLPPALRQREVPSSRLPLEAITFAGHFAPQQVEDTPGSNGTAGEDHP